MNPLLPEPTAQSSPHLRIVLSTTNPCSLWNAPSSIKRSPQHASELRDAAIKQIQAKYKVGLNFHADELNAELLRNVMIVLDQIFYANTLMSSIFRLGIKISFRVERFQQDQLQPVAKTIAFTRHGERRPEKLTFSFNRNRFGESACFRVTNGVPTRHKLEALLVTCLHELVHAMIFTFCRQDEGHGDIFKGINSAINGHHHDFFQYFDLPPDRWSQLDDETQALIIAHFPSLAKTHPVNAEALAKFQVRDKDGQLKLLSPDILHLFQNPS